ncbi:MAG: type II toxin-antitoxin system RelB/DinJ family antitoxin [Oscillospiraceae bacterium]|jgi:DNA-damage-inducible protein J|nr:type II toxin-antitoxin system RelB/DinJ family antitoxin [Oscillospiraceae bacterium]
MAKNAVINIRTESETKKAIEHLFSQFGITISDAVNIFFNQALMQNGFPFTPQVPTPNAATLAAMEEVEEMLKTGSGKGFNSMEELLADLNA